MNIKLTINLIQIGTFFSFVCFGIIRLSDDNFPFMIPISSFSFLMSIILLLFMTRTKIYTSSNIWNKKKDDSVMILDSLMFIMLPLMLFIIILLAYFKAINPKYSDFLSILALGISLSNDFLSNLVAKIILSLSNRIKNKQFEDLC